MFPQRTPEQFLGQTADLIELVDTRYSDFNERTKWKAAERSPHYYFAEKATRQYGPDVPNWSAALIDTAMIGAQTYVFAATQHCSAIAVLLRAHHIGVPLAPLARSAAEASARSIWLLDHRDITIRQRCARSFLDQRDSLRREKQSAKALKHPELPKIAQQLSDLERRFLPAWFYKSEIEREPNGNLVLAGQRMPGPAQMVVEASKITSSADAPGAYAYLSSGAHPTYFAIHEMLTSTQIGAGHVRHQIDFTDVRYQASLGANAVADVLFGWNRLATWLGLGDSAEFDGCA